MILRSILVVSLLLIVASGVQAQVAEPKAAYMLDSFGRVPNGDTKGRLDLLYARLSESSGSKAVIYAYGDRDYVSLRMRFFREYAQYRRFDGTRIKYVRGPNIGEFRADVWLIPLGAVEPNVKPEAWIFSDVGVTSMGRFQQQTRKFFEVYKKSRVDQGYIINYGTPQIAQREKWILNQLDFRKPDRPRITMVNGGAGKVRTVFWFVPPKAENPKL